MNFIWLLFAHYLGDIAWQSEWQAANKRRYLYVLFSHGMIWTGAVSVALAYLGLLAWWKVLFLLAGHMAMDAWKSRQPKTPEAFKLIYVDQGWHIMQLAAVYLL